MVGIGTEVFYRGDAVAMPDFGIVTAIEKGSAIVSMATEGRKQFPVEDIATEYYGDPDTIICTKDAFKHYQDLHIAWLMSCCAEGE